MTERYLVTGAEGFIGSHLVEELVMHGYSVRAMVLYNFENRWGWLESLPSKVLDEVEVVIGDIRDPYSAMEVVSGCSKVFHLAALIGIPYSYIAPDSYVQTNVTGTLNILQACRRASVERLIHTSTSETYGTAQYEPIDEKHPLVGQSPYSASKVAADKLAESFYLSFALPVSTIRPFNTYGPRQSSRAVIPTIMSQVLGSSDSIELGSLDPVRDMTFVKDTVSGFLSVSESDAAVGRVTNIGSGKGITIGELAKLILDIFGSSATIRQSKERIRPEKSEVLKLICDSSFAREQLGWEPKFDLRTGLTETADWIRAHQDIYKSRTYTV